MKTSDLLIKALENEGVEYIFGIPGEENLDLLESLSNSNIQLVLTRHEQGAGFMAAAYGRLTGKTGVCLATLGPGATNFITCASYALLGGMPILFITGQKPIKKSKQARFQIIDVISSMRPVTKFTKQIVDGNNVPSLIRECFRIAESEKPGPCHLELPEDIAAENVDRIPFDVVKVDPPGASNDSIQSAAKMIEKAKLPLICIASGANRNKCHDAIANFVNKTGLYFFSTQMGKGSVDERHQKCLGTAALSDNDYIHCAIEKADLIINIGHDVSEKPPFFMQQNSDTKVIHLSYHQAQMDDVYFPHHEVIGCLNANLTSLAKAIEESSRWDFSFFEKTKKEIDEHLFNRSNQDSFPNTPQRIVSDIRSIVPDDGIISLDNGMYKIWFARNYPAYQSNTLLLDNALASMGAGLPAAIGAKLAYPERKVVAVCGDGGFMMNSQEMETAIRLSLDLVVIVINDQSYGMIKWKQASMNFKNFGLDFKNPDFVKYAESYGAKGTRIKASGELTEVVKNAFDEGGVHLIDLPIDYSENMKVFNEELKDKVCLV